MVEESIKQSVKRYLSVLRDNGIEPCFGVVFGSWAHGGADAESDIDVVVVSPWFDTHRSRKDISLLWRLTIESDIRIEPIAAGEREWREDTSRAILEIARREGERIDFESAA